MFSVALSGTRFLLFFNRSLNHFIFVTTAVFITVTIFLGICRAVDWVLNTFPTMTAFSSIATFYLNSEEVHIIVSWLSTRNTIISGDSANHFRTSNGMTVFCTIHSVGFLHTFNCEFFFSWMRNRECAFYWRGYGIWWTSMVIWR